MRGSVILHISHSCFTRQGVSYPDGKMQLSQHYVSRRGTRPESAESAARLSQLYLAWGEGVTFAA